MFVVRLYIYKQDNVVCCFVCALIDTRAVPGRLGDEVARRRGARSSFLSIFTVTKVEPRELKGQKSRKTKK